MSLTKADGSNERRGSMTGTPSQIEWAELIKPRVVAEFARVAQAFETVAAKQAEADRQDTYLILAILEEKRAEVLANDHAGYFVRGWQELGDQVRKLIDADPRYQGLKSRKATKILSQPKVP
jgi:hypothetical protein